MGISLQKMKITTAIAAMSGALVVASLLVLGLIISLVMSNKIQEDAVSAQNTNLRVAAGMFEKEIPGADIRWDASGNVSRVMVESFPTFDDNTLVDEIGRMTGEVATIFRWDAGRNEFIRAATNVIESNGTRAVGTPLGNTSDVHAAVVKGETYLGESNVLGEMYYAVYKPMLDTDGNIVGILCVAVQKARITAVFFNLLQSLGIALLPVVAIALFVSVYLARRLMLPIKDLAQVTEQISHENLSIDVPYTERTDEIAMLANSVSTLKQRSQERVELTAKQAEADRVAFERQEKIEALIANFRVEIHAMLQSVSKTAVDLDATAETLTGVAQESAARAQETLGASDDATNNVQSVASAAEELASSISEISRQVLQTNDIVARATTSSRETNAKVESLAESASKISEVISLIQAIAEQTNLLALNATIEAARAGEAGKSFAVVANEVKELANQTSHATEEISAQISAIQAATGESVQAISGISSIIDEVNSYTTAIASAVEEQSAATAEISENVQRAASGTTSVSGNMTQLSEAVARTSTSADMVLSSAGSLTEKTDALSKEVEQFLSRVAAA